MLRNLRSSMCAPANRSSHLVHLHERRSHLQHNENHLQGHQSIIAPLITRRIVFHSRTRLHPHLQQSRVRQSILVVLVTSACSLHRSRPMCLSQQPGLQARRHQVLHSALEGPLGPQQDHRLAATYRHLDQPLRSNANGSLIADVNLAALMRLCRVAVVRTGQMGRVSASEGLRKVVRSAVRDLYLVRTYRLHLSLLRRSSHRTDATSRMALIGNLDRLTGQRTKQICSKLSSLPTTPAEAATDQGTQKTIARIVNGAAGIQAVSVDLLSSSSRPEVPKKVLQWAVTAMYEAAAHETIEPYHGTSESAILVRVCSQEIFEVTETRITLLADRSRRDRIIRSPALGTMSASVRRHEAHRHNECLQIREGEV